MDLQLISPHAKDLGGGFTVRRLLPAVARQAVGPFLFFDHFGPVTAGPADDHDVRPHPHIGLATVTYLFEGAMMHRDSLGTEQLVEPGAVNWMTSGRGIVHSERKPEPMRRSPYVNHGLQLWVALPEAMEEVEASFQHVAAADIPEVSLDGARARLMVGEALGVRSPVKPASPTLYLDLALPGGVLDLPPLAPELALYPIEGELRLDGQPMPPHHMQVLEPGRVARIEAAGPARLVVVGGESVGPRYMYWNFVSSRKERILQASADWEAMRMGTVPGDDEEFIPLPPTRFTPPEPRS